jgi:hypothetical protein
MHIALENEGFLALEITQNFDGRKALCHNGHRYGKEENTSLWTPKK